MHVKQAINNRYSERTYKPDKPSAEEVYELLDAGRLAPSACNKQPWKFIVVSEADNLKKIAETYPREWFAKVPMLIVICGEHAEAWKRTATDNKDHTDIDVAIAVDHITLRAVELGLATCWICAFNPNEIAKILKLPIGTEPVAILSVGYPNGKIPEKKRKNLDEIVYSEEYGFKYFK